MRTIRKWYELRGGEVLDIQEYHDGKYGAKGKKRLPKKKPTKEDMQKVNEWNRARLIKIRLLEYFTFGDLWVTLTYIRSNRPPDMKTVADQIAKLLRKLRAEYRKCKRELFWYAKIEKGTKGGWHIHIVINDIGNTASMLVKNWEYGEVKSIAIKNSQFYDEDFTKLANYLAKNENSVEYKEDGTPAKPRIKESRCTHSRNMPLPEPKKKKLVHWKREIKPKKGYYIAAYFEGQNPKTGFSYRRYTLIKLNRRI